MLSKLFKCLNGNPELNDTEVSDEFCKRHRAGVYFGFLPLLLFFLFIWLATQETLPQWVCFGFGLGLVSLVVVFSLRDGLLPLSALLINPSEQSIWNVRCFVVSLKMREVQGANTA